MLKASANHYSRFCRDASAERLSYEGNRPGFLRAMANCEKNWPGYVHDLTFRELDTLAKILEQGHYCATTRTAIDRLTKLRTGITRTLTSLNDNVFRGKPIVASRKTRSKLPV